MTQIDFYTTTPAPWHGAVTRCGHPWGRGPNVGQGSSLLLRQFLEKNSAIYQYQPHSQQLGKWGPWSWRGDLGGRLQHPVESRTCKIQILLFRVSSPSTVIFSRILGWCVRGRLVGATAALTTEAGVGNTADTHLLSLLSLLGSLPSQIAYPLL